MLTCDRTNCVVCMFCCLVEAQMMMCRCSEIPSMIDSPGSAVDGSGVAMLNVTGMYTTVTLLLVTALIFISIRKFPS